MFQEKYAKLHSNIKNDNYATVVQVFDDEQENSNNPIMWLTAYVEEDHINVQEINFDDDLFFELPKRRQDACPIVLFKAFLKWYNENYGKNTENWMPVGADFANYALQEKFKDAINKGIFPKESLNYIDETTEEDYNSQTTYNKGNRELIYDLQQNPAKYFGEEYTISNGYILNIPVSKLVEKTKNLKSDMDKTYFYGYVDNGNVYMQIPYSQEYSRGKDTEFDYDADIKSIDFYHLNEDNLNNFLSSNDISNMKITFDDIDRVYFGLNSLSIDDFYQMVEQSKKTAKRLIKKRG